MQQEQPVMSKKLQDEQRWLISTAARTLWPFFALQGLVIVFSCYIARTFLFCASNYLQCNYLTLLQCYEVRGKDVERGRGGGGDAGSWETARAP